MSQTFTIRGRVDGIRRVEGGVDVVIVHHRRVKNGRVRELIAESNTVTVLDGLLEHATDPIEGEFVEITGHRGGVFVQESGRLHITRGMIATSIQRLDATRRTWLTMVGRWGLEERNLERS